MEVTMKASTRTSQIFKSAPVFAFDKEGEEHDRVIYLIHGRMIGYYINTDTGEVVRGKHLRKHFMSIGYLSVKMGDGFWMKSGRKMKWMWSGCKAAPSHS